MVAEALESATSAGGRFYGAMENQSGTFAGQMSTLQDGIVNLKGQLASGITTMLSGTVLPMVNTWVPDLSAAFEKDGIPGIITALGEVIKEALAFISEQLPVLVETAMTLVTALAEGLIEALPAITEAALQLVIALVEGIVELLPQLIEAALVIITTLAQGIGQALPELIPAAVNQTATASTLTAASGGVDVESLVGRMVPAIVSGLDLRVVLHDGTLVGRLAPRIDQSLATLKATRPALAI